MSTLQTTKTLFISVGPTKYAYRRLGPSSQKTTPVLFLMHFRGTMDHWDPALIHPIAEKHPVILFDNAGVGHSTGEIPSSIPEMAGHVVAFLEAVGVERVVLYGFSIGGMVAMQVALDTRVKGLVERLVLSGTGPGRGVMGGEELLRADSEEVMRVATRTPVTVEAMMKLFFLESGSSEAAGRAWWKRIFERNVETSGEERADYVSGKGVMAQALALGTWAGGKGAYDRLPELKLPTFVSNGVNDFMVPTQHSYVISQRIPYTHLHIYPDSGHGHCFQFPEHHAEHVLAFLAE